MQIVTTHKNADFDAFASVIAATLLFPNAIAVLPKTLNPNVKAFLSIHKELFLTRTPAEVDLKAVNRLVVVDANSWSRLDRMEALKDRKGLEILVWDHHLEKGPLCPKPSVFLGVYRLLSRPRAGPQNPLRL